jgi:hypothetical protein
VVSVLCLAEASCLAGFSDSALKPGEGVRCADGEEFSILVRFFREVDDLEKEHLRDAACCWAQRRKVSRTSVRRKEGNDMREEADLNYSTGSVKVQASKET